MTDQVDQLPGRLKLSVIAGKPLVYTFTLTGHTITTPAFTILNELGGTPIAGVTPTVTTVGAAARVALDQTATAAIGALNGGPSDTVVIYELSGLIDGAGPHSLAAGELTVHPQGYAGPTNSTGTTTLTLADGASIEITVTISGATTIDSLTDVSAANPAVGDLLSWDGSAWVKATRSALAQDPAYTSRYLPKSRVTGWQPANVIDETVSRIGKTETGSALTSGTLYLFGGLEVPDGQTVASISFMTGGTGALSLTNQWFCLVRLSDLALLGVTANDGSTAWANNTRKTLTMASAWSNTTGAAVPVYAGIVVTAGTMPNLAGVGVRAEPSALTPKTCGTSNTGLTTPASLSSVSAMTATWTHHA